MTPEPVELWCCDGCLRMVSTEEIATMADGEHVICDACDTRLRAAQDAD